MSLIWFELLGKVSFTALGLISVVESIMKSSSRKIRSVIDEALNRFEEVFKHVAKTDKGLVK